MFKTLVPTGLESYVAQRQWKKLVKTGKNWQKPAISCLLRSYYRDDDLQLKKAELVKPQAIKSPAQSN